MVATIAGVNRLCRTSRSTGTGLEPSNWATDSRASAGASSSSGRAGASSDGQRCGASPSAGRPPSASASSTSFAFSTNVAPCRIRRLGPLARGSSGEPGTAITSRPCSSASRAVISEPERAAPSTTTTPRDSPAMILLRRGKCRPMGTVPSGASAITVPSASSRSWSARFSLG